MKVYQRWTPEVSDRELKAFTERESARRKLNESGTAFFRAMTRRK